MLNNAAKRQLEIPKIQKPNKTNDWAFVTHSLQRTRERELGR